MVMAPALRLVRHSDDIRWKSSSSHTPAALAPRRRNSGGSRPASRREARGRERAPAFAKALTMPAMTRGVNPAAGPSPGFRAAARSCGHRPRSACDTRGATARGNEQGCLSRRAKTGRAFGISRRDLDRAAGRCLSSEQGRGGKQGADRVQGRIPWRFATCAAAGPRREGGCPAVRRIQSPAPFCTRIYSSFTPLSQPF